MPNNRANTLPPPDLPEETPDLPTTAPAVPAGNFNQAVRDFWDKFQGGTDYHDYNPGGRSPAYSSEGDSGPNINPHQQAIADYWQTYDNAIQSYGEGNFGIEYDASGNPVARGYGGSGNETPPQDRGGQQSDQGGQSGDSSGSGRGAAGNPNTIDVVRFGGGRVFAPGGPLSPGMSAYYGLGGGYGQFGLSGSAAAGGDVASHSEGGAPSLGTEGGGIGMGTRTGTATGEIPESALTSWEARQAKQAAAPPAPAQKVIGYKWTPNGFHTSWQVGTIPSSPLGPGSHGPSMKGFWQPVMEGSNIKPDYVGTTPPQNILRRRG